MTLLALFVYLIIAGVVGSIAQVLVGFGRGGFLVAVLVGLVGALLGSWLADQLGMSSVLPVTVGGETIEIVWTLIGAVLLLLLLSLVRGPARWRTFS